MRTLATDPVNRSHPANRGKAAWLLSPERTAGGKYAYDLMGGLYRGALTGFGVAVSGWRAGSTPGTSALLFDGSASWLDLRGYSLVGPGPWCFAATVTPASTSGGSHNIFTSGSGTSYSAQLRREGGAWNLYQANSGDINVSASGIVAGKKTRIMAWWDGVVIGLAVDGVIAGTTACNAIQHSGTVNSIGTDVVDYGSSGGQWWDGAIEDISIWRRAPANAREVWSDRELSRSASRADLAWEEDDGLALLSPITGGYGPGGPPYRLVEMATNRRRRAG